MVLIAPTARENAVLIDHQHHAIVLWLRRRCRLDRAEERSHHLEGIGTMARPAMAWRVSPSESCTEPAATRGELPWISFSEIRPYFWVSALGAHRASAAAPSGVRS